MARVMSSQSAKIRAHAHFPSWLRQNEHAKMLDLWGKGEQGRDELYMPKDREIDQEYKDIADRAKNPWLMLIINVLQQTFFVDGVRMPGENENLEVYRIWHENGFDSKQAPLYRGAMAHGASYVTALPAKRRLGGGKTVLWTPRSAKRMATFFNEDDDEFPELAIDATEQWWESPWGGGLTEQGYRVQLIDDQAVHHLTVKGEGQDLADWEYHDYEEHNLGVTPVIDYPNMTDLDGRNMGEIEPFIPLARRIDQDIFDRLIVQRFGAWKVRYITGLVKPKDVSEKDYQARVAALKIGDFLVTEDPASKVGTIEENQLDGFIKAGDADLRMLAAASQTPPHHMLGLSPQMQPEALAAAEGGLRAKSVERKTTFGERHERLFRLTAHIMGNRAEAEAFDMQVRWRDMETRSLSQAADALGKLAVQVGVPQEMLFEKIPGWTDFDVQRAKELVESGAIDRLIEQLANNTGTKGQPTGNPTGQPTRQPAGV